MIRLVYRPMVPALAAAFGLVALVPAAAQAQEYGSPQPDPRGAERISETVSERPGKRTDARERAPAIAANPPRFPDATRVAPGLKASQKMVKHLQELQALFEKKDMPGVIAKAAAIEAMPTAGVYEKSYAFTVAAEAATALGDQAQAAGFLGKALAANGLDNDGHFSALFNLAVIQYGLEKYPAALATIDDFLAQTRSTRPEHQSFRAGILSNMDRHEEAAAIYRDLAAKNPADKRVLMNAVAAFQAAGKQDQSTMLLEDAHRRGMLSESRELRALYVGYMNAERWGEARKVIDDGVAKGVLQPSADLARDYMVLAQTAFGDDEVALASELYAKAAPMAADGEAYLNLAKVLEHSGKKAAAKEAAQKALDKGLKKPDQARDILAR